MTIYRYIVIVGLLFGPLLSRAQKDGEGSFAAFAQQQGKLFVSLYEKRDVKSYTSQLDILLQRFDSLSAPDKKQYASYLANVYYNLSCTYALLGNNKLALDYLEKSIQTGYHNYAHMMKDSDLESIRRESRFISLLKPLKETGDYLYILRKAKDYNLTDMRPLPAFTYQAADNPDLAALRKGFNLDSIAGKGNDVSQVLNLLHWVHEIIPHDGNHENPAVKNALNMITVCRKESRGLNCRGLATVLNECYLALGFRSRLVTCLPKDSLGTDPDCHVINMVYVPSLKKWIWADPTNDAYVMNEKGELLGIQEVRERLIRNEPLILNPTANWNHRSSVVKEEYLYNYMAKNLYILQCPVNSTYNYETAERGKSILYIQLLPLDYFKQSPAVKETTSARSGAIYQYYNTNNPAGFWQIP